MYELRKKGLKVDEQVAISIKYRNLFKVDQKIKIFSKDKKFNLQGIVRYVGKSRSIAVRIKLGIEFNLETEYEKYLAYLHAKYFI